MTTKHAPKRTHKMQDYVTAVINLRHAEHMKREWERCVYHAKKALLVAERIAFPELDRSRK